jgi:hypothetical protein
MNDSIRVMRWPRRAWPPAARTAAAIIATAGLAVLATACGGSPSSTGSGGASNAGGSASSPSAVAYSGCMRSHGVPNFPDPPSGGGVPKGSAQQFGVSSSQLQAGQTACQQLYPNNGGSIQQCETTGDCPQALVQQAVNVMRKYARCMRSHGCRTGPTPPSIPKGALFSMSVTPGSPTRTRTRRRSSPRIANASAWQAARQAYPCRWGEVFR